MTFLLWKWILLKWIYETQWNQYRCLLNYVEMISNKNVKRFEYYQLALEDEAQNMILLDQACQ